MTKNPVKTFVIDLFCGAGGTSTAIFKAKTNIEVVMCINHDKNAILSHKKNYPNCIHFIEDIRTVAMQPIIDLVAQLRRLHPGCKIAIWASLECTNHSRAKGGQSRDADSRSLADHLVRYIEAICPDFLWIENVREFMEWGPLRMKEGKKSTSTYCELALDKKGDYIFIPVKEQKGIYYKAWVDLIKSYGFSFDWKLLNSANYGGFTTRERYFSQFAKSSEEIEWAEPTHSKNGKGSRKWKAVRRVLNLKNEGQSIFSRSKMLCDNSLTRLYNGLVKFVPGETESCFFLSAYYGGSNCYVSSTDPCGTLPTHDRYAKYQVQFITSYYSGGGQLSSVQDPSPALLGNPKQRLTSVQFIDNQYGNSNPTSMDKPIGAMTPTPKQNVVTVDPFIINGNSSTAPARDINDPGPTLTQRTHLLAKPVWLMDTSFDNVGSTIDEPARVLLASRKHHYLVNPQYVSKGSSVEQPCFTLIARTDKAPPSIVTVDQDKGKQIEISGFLTELDVQHMIDQSTQVYGPRIEKSIRVKIIEFMLTHGIADIKMRMLEIEEMLKIQGFPAKYKLVGTQTQKKKYIGNSVEVNVGKSLFKAIDSKIQRVAA